MASIDILGVAVNELTLALMKSKTAVEVFYRKEFENGGNGQMLRLIAAGENSAVERMLVETVRAGLQCEIYLYETKALELLWEAIAHQCECIYYG